MLKTMSKKVDAFLQIEVTILVHRFFVPMSIRILHISKIKNDNR